jgi:hypothetical protein
MSASVFVDNAEKKIRVRRYETKDKTFVTLNFGRDEIYISPEQAKALLTALESPEVIEVE